MVCIHDLDRDGDVNFFNSDIELCCSVNWTVVVRVNHYYYSVTLVSLPCMVQVHFQVSF